MTMARKKNFSEINFLSNPDNVGIGDWVSCNGKIGKISERVKTGPNMLKFWIEFIDGNIDSALAEHLTKVNQPTSLNKFIHLDLITIDHNLQQRVRINSEVVDDYAEAYQNGQEFPPIIVWYCYDDKKRYLVDGVN